MTADIVIGPHMDSVRVGMIAFAIGGLLLVLVLALLLVAGNPDDNEEDY